MLDCYFNINCIKKPNLRIFPEGWTNDHSSTGSNSQPPIVFTLVKMPIIIFLIQEVSFFHSSL